MSDDLRKQIHQSKPAHGARGSGAVDPSRPNTVIYAVYLASGAIALVAVGAMVRLAVNLATSPARALPTYPLAVVIVSLMAVGLWGLEAFLIYGTWLGRNRSRILYIGLTLVAIIGTLMNTGVIEGLAKQPLGAGQFILTTCLELVAVTLLVLPVSNAWFREMRARKPVANVMKPERPVESLSSGIPLADSQRRWVPLALSVVVILLLSWPVYSSGGGMLFGPYLPNYNVWLCLPVQAVTMLLGALIGAKGAGVPSERWKRATYGVWIGGLAAIGLRVCGMCADFGVNFMQSL